MSMEGRRWVFAKGCETGHRGTLDMPSCLYDREVWTPPGSAHLRILADCPSPSEQRKWHTRTLRGYLHNSEMTNALSQLPQL